MEVEATSGGGVEAAADEGCGGCWLTAEEDDDDDDGAVAGLVWSVVPLTASFMAPAG